MRTYEQLVANRLRLAMKPVSPPDYPGPVFSATYTWRIRAILHESKWEQKDLSIPLSISTSTQYYYYLDFIDFLMLGKWSEDD